MDEQQPPPSDQQDDGERQDRSIEDRIDLDELTEAVARLLRRDLEIARERLGRRR